MPTQDPKEGSSLKPKLLATASLVTNDVQSANDEDRLDSIASSLPPFPPESDDVMETESESANNVASNFQSDSYVLTGGAFPPKEACDILNYKSIKSNIPNKRKKMERNLPSPVSGGDGSGGADDSSSGKHVCDSHANGSEYDLSSLSNTNKYDRTSQGPFDVIIQSAENSTSSIDPIAVGRLLYSISKKDILEIKKIGFSKISIQFKSREAANSLISNPILKTKRYNAYIPLFRTTRKGIIRNVPLDLPDEEIRRGIDSGVVVISVKRLNRRRRSTDVSQSSSSDGQESTLIPCKTVLITFKGQSLPGHIYLFMVRHSVEPFVTKTSLCYTCLRYGHLKAQCKGHPRCQHCGERAHEDPTSCPKKDGPPFCINCRGPHRTTSLSCPEYNIQRRIRELAAYDNIPLAEARGRIRGCSASRTPGPSFNIGEFPSLHNPPSPPSSSHPHPPSSSLPPSSFPLSFSSVLHSKVPSKANASAAPLPSFSAPSLSHPNQKCCTKDYNNNNGSASSHPRSFQKNKSQRTFSSPPNHNSLLISPHGRLPSSTDEKVDFHRLRFSAPYPPPSHPSNFNPNLNPELCDQLFSLFNVLMEKLAPILKLLGLYDSVAEFLSSLLQSLSSRGPASNPVPSDV